MYKLVWKDEALDDLAKIDRVIAQKLFTKIETCLVKNPTEYGKPLIGNLKGLWSYRFSNYRVIYQLKQSELLITVVAIAHRRKVY